MIILPTPDLSSTYRSTIALIQRYTYVNALIQAFDKFLVDDTTMSLFTL